MGLYYSVTFTLHYQVHIHDRHLQTKSPPADYSTGPLVLIPRSHNTIVIVEFDIKENKEWDPHGPHVGININIISSVVNASWDYSAVRSRKVANAQIAYNATTNMLSVLWRYEEDSKPVSGGSTNSLSYQINLRDVLPELVTIGFSASFGREKGNYVIISWEFNSISNSDERSKFNDISSNNGEKRKHAFFVGVVSAISFFILMLGVALCTVVVKKQRAIKGHGNVYSTAAVPFITKNLERLAFPRRFAYQELVVATIGFAKDRRLGQVGSAQVHKGVLQDIGCTIAVKRI